MTQLSLFKNNRHTNNSMLFDMLIEDEKHTTLYVKTRYTIYLYDCLNPEEARAMIQLIKDSVQWDLYSQSYSPILWGKFRQQWPETMSQVNYTPNF
jgi:hypothetical protein